jgi:hypothetical protein
VKGDHEEDGVGWGSPERVKRVGYKTETVRQSCGFCLTVSLTLATLLLQTAD